MAADFAKRRAPRYGETQQMIADIVKRLPQGTHLTAPEVYERTRDLGLDVSLSTVYRALHRLKLHGNVSTVSGERGLRYEIADATSNHGHLICLSCGTTIEFVDELIAGFGKNVAERKGFEHTSSRFDILGYCRECSANDFGHQLQQSLVHLASAMELAQNSEKELTRAIELLELRKLGKSVAIVQTVIDKLTEAIQDCQDSITLATKGSSA